MSLAFHDVSQCIFIASNTTDTGLLHHAINITVTAHWRDAVIGYSAGATLGVLCIVAVLLLMCVVVQCRTTKKQDSCNCKVAS